MQSQPHTIARITALLAFSVMFAVTGCSKKDEATTNDQAASVAEATAAPMSAAPADEKGAPIVNEDTAAMDAGPEAASGVAATSEVDASNVDAGSNESLEGEADNSAMDKISENDQVIDNEPASPNAPRAEEEQGKNIGNAKVGSN